MSLWTIELIRTEIGPKPWLRSGRLETWLWRAFKGAEDLSTDRREEMYQNKDYLSGVSESRITPRLNALAEAQRACKEYDRRRGGEVRDLVGYDTGLTEKEFS